MKNNILISFILVCTNVFGSVADHLSLIQSSIDSEEYLIAEVNCETAISEYDANAALYFIRAQVAVKLDRLDDANKYFIKAIELDNKNESYRLEQEKLSELKDGMTNARNIFDRGRMDDAIIEYEKLSSAFANNAIVFYNLGRVYKVNEEFNLAVQNYKIAMNLNPFEKKRILYTSTSLQILYSWKKYYFKKREKENGVKNERKIWTLKYKEATKVRIKTH